MNPFPRAITLPSPLQNRLEAAARDFLDADQSGLADFAGPAGEPALLPYHAISWRIFKNPLALFVGGVAAVILELAEPRVRTGVWDHTAFRSNAMRRVRRTGLSALVTVYGPRSRAEAMIADVRRMHARVSGCTPGGQPYRADDPELLDWVHATASFGFLEAYHTYACRLDDAQRDRFIAEGAPSARLFGAVGAPATQQQLAGLFEKMRGRLEPSPIVLEFLDIMLRAPVLPPPFSAFQGMLVMAAIAILPEWIQERLELTGRWRPRAWQRLAVRQIGAAADRIVLRSGPAVQACRRLGLPDDYLYSRD